MVGGLPAFLGCWIVSTSLAFVVHNPWIMSAELPKTSSPDNQKEEEQEWSQPRVSRRRQGGAGLPRLHHHQQDNDAWKEPVIPIEYIPPDDVNTLFQPFMLLLAGIPGSGKSTFARCLVEAMPYKVTSSFPGMKFVRAISIPCSI